MGAFTNANPINFHIASGEGYGFLTEQILRLNHTNPQIAARLLTPFTRWRRYPDKLGNAMKAELERIKAEPKLSKDVYEVVSKSLV